MDIFTTVLTRVVPVPIKPTSLKVKALLKEAKTSKLKEDPDHLENHDYYFGHNKKNQKESEQDESVDSDQVDSINAESVNKNDEGKHEDNHESNDGVTESEDGVKHLDLYV